MRRGGALDAARLLRRDRAGRVPSGHAVEVLRASPLGPWRRLVSLHEPGRLNQLPARPEKKRRHTARVSDFLDDMCADQPEKDRPCYIIHWVIDIWCRVEA